jgi:hypothetical protein
MSRGGSRTRRFEAIPPSNVTCDGVAVERAMPNRTCRGLHGTEIERPLAIVMIGGLVTSTVFTLLVLPTFYLQVHGWLDRRARSSGDAMA